MATLTARIRVLTAEDLTPRIARYIDGKFAQHVRDLGKTRFCEKTPSNCLRIPFIHALYPDCKIIHIYRDGRAVTRSMLRSQTVKPLKGTLWNKMTTTPILEWPSYVPMLMRTYWQTNVRKQPATYWGPQPPGWQDWIALPRHLQVGHQWRALVETALEEGRKLPAENYMELRYEDLIAEPQPMIASMLEFTEIESAPEIWESAAERIDPARAEHRPTNMTEAEDAELLELMRPLLDRLGYE